MLGLVLERLLTSYKVEFGDDSDWGVWWGRGEWFNGDDGRGGVEGEGSSSSSRLISDGCGHLVDDGEEEIVGENWEVGGREEVLWFMIVGLLLG